MNSTDINPEREMDVNPYSLEEWNNDLSIHLIPNSVVLALYFLIGLIGNSVVIVVYRYRFKNNRNDRFFIPHLAIADLSASVTCSVFTFGLNFQQANFENESFCKSMWFFSTLSAMSSIFILLIITVERYLKICKPLRFELKLYTKRILLVIVITCAVALAIPTVIFFGKVPTFISNKNITRFRCTRTRGWENNEPLYFSIVLSTCIILTPICICVLYIRIGVKLHQHIKFRKQFHINTLKKSTTKSLSVRSNSRCKQMSEDCENTGVFRQTVNEYENKGFEEENINNDWRVKSVKNVQHPKKSRVELYKYSCDCQSTQNTASGVFTTSSAINEIKRHMTEKRQSYNVASTLSNDISRNAENDADNVCDVLKEENPKQSGMSLKRKSNFSNLNHSMNEKYVESPGIQRRLTKQKTDENRRVNNLHQFTMMFMLLAGICVLSYVPKIILLLMESIQKTFWVDITDDLLGVALFFYRLFILNNVCNPIVYCFCDPRFRRELKLLCKCCN